MAIDLIREGEDGFIEYNVPISTTSFYLENWERARIEMGIKIFQEDGYFNLSQLNIVMQELDLYRVWAEKNLYGNDMKYMIERIDNLKKEIPQMFTNDEIILYIY